MCLGVIYTNSKKFEVPQFFKKEKLENFDINNNTPSIILGKKNSIELLGEVRVLNRQINDNLFWTYNKLEKRSEYEIDIENFYNMVFKKLIKTIKYKNINVYTLTLSKVKELYSILNDNTTQKSLYITKNMLYMYHNNIVYGISLEEIQYIGLDISKVIDKFTRVNKIEIITNNNFIKNEVKKYLINNDYLTPYLYLLI